MPCGANGHKSLILYTGGTIGMVKDENEVLVPKNVLLERISKHTDLCNWCDLNKGLFRVDLKEGRFSYTVIEYDPLFESSNMGTNEWIKIATDIKDNIDKYESFIILHGTDTMAYTASALSFMLDGLTKPVILTGAQIPLLDKRSDGKSNILSSLVFGSKKNLQEVCICFNHKLFRGNRSVKYSVNSFNGFITPNYHLLAEDGMEFVVYKNYVNTFPKSPTFRVFFDLNPCVTLLRFCPEMQLSHVQSATAPPNEGVVMITYGAGNISSNRSDILDELKKSIDNGLIIVNVTECFHGTVSPSYQPGKILIDLGVLPGYDMTVPAAITKLSYVLGQKDLNLCQKKKMMTSNIRALPYCRRKFHLINGNLRNRKLLR